MSCPASRTRLCLVQMVARYLPGVKESIELTGRRPPATAAAAARCSGIGRSLRGLARCARARARAPLSRPRAPRRV
jgi:hypothetical protein